MKWYNVEITPMLGVDLRYFLKNNKIDFETSGCNGYIHFEIYASKKQVTMINSFLDTLYI